MGQYFELYALTDRGYEKAEHNFEDFGGMKLMEHSYLGNNLSTFLQNKLANEWKGARIYHIGDYADMEYPEAKNVYKKNGINSQRYVANLDKKVFIDTWKTVPDFWGFRIDPVLLLAALGNGRGGGDYHSNFNAYTIGTWAGDRLSASNNLDEYMGFSEIYPLFTEESKYADWDYDDEDYNLYQDIAKDILNAVPEKILKEMLLKDNIEDNLRNLIQEKLKNHIKGE